MLANAPFLGDIHRDGVYSKGIGNFNRFSGKRLELTCSSPSVKFVTLSLKQIRIGQFCYYGE
jgi:hypothetical protein